MKLRRKEKYGSNVFVSLCDDVTDVVMLKHKRQIVSIVHAQIKMASSVQSIHIMI